MSLPKTVWVKENETPSGKKTYLIVERDQIDLLTNKPATIGEYRLVRTKRRKLVAADA